MKCFVYSRVGGVGGGKGTRKKARACGRVREISPAHKFAILPGTIREIHVGSVQNF